MLEDSLLWSISKEGLPESYLFGTMHIKNEDSYKHVEPALAKLYLCEEFKTEIDLAEASSILNAEHYFLPNDQRVSDFYSPKKYYKMRTIIQKSFAFDLQVYERLLPIIITNKLSERILKSESGKSLDAFLWSEADRLKLKLGGLETMEEQLAILTKLELGIQLKMLKDLAADVRRFRKSIIKMGELYSNQDIQQLHKMTKKSLGKLRKMLLYDRNELMTTRILSNLSSKTFYAVGAAHLGGNKGILSLLKKKNLKLKAIN